MWSTAAWWISRDACIPRHLAATRISTWNEILLCLLPKDVRGAGLGILMTVEGLGGVIGALLWQVSNPSAPFYLSGGLLLIASSAATQWRAKSVEG